MNADARRSLLAFALVGALLLLSGCSGSGGSSLPGPTSSVDRPTPSFSRSSPATSEPSRSSQPEESSDPAPSKSKTPEPKPTQDDEDSQQGSSGEDTSATDDAVDAQAASDRDPSDVSWGWLLFAILVAGAVGVPLFLRSRRRSSWSEQFEAARVEVAWFARELIPELGQQVSVDLVAGGWRLSRARVVAAEDVLTGLVTSAPDVDRAGRARVLRDAVRSARGLVDAGTTPGARSAIGVELAAAAARLEAALAPADGNHPPA